jgi:hypothetical protein
MTLGQNTSPASYRLQASRKSNIVAGLEDYQNNTGVIDHAAAAENDV